MSGSFPDANEVAKGDDIAAAFAQLPQVMARVHERQAQAFQFVAEYGAAVLDGHTPNVVVPPVLEG